jgi:hypothetical protein
MNNLAMDVTGEAASGQQHVMTVVTAIWEKILGKEGIGPNEEFFDLGGNSMLLIAMIDAVQGQLKQDIELAQLASGITIDKVASLFA